MAPHPYSRRGKAPTKKPVVRLPDHQVTDATYKWIKGWLSCVNGLDDMPDGAYWELHREGCDAYIDWVQKQGKEACRFDWYDIQGDYIEWSNAQLETQNGKKEQDN